MILTPRCCIHDHGKIHLSCQAVKNEDESKSNQGSQVGTKTSGKPRKGNLEANQNTATCRTPEGSSPSKLRSNYSSNPHLSGAFCETFTWSLLSQSLLTNGIYMCTVYVYIYSLLYIYTIDHLHAYALWMILRHISSGQAIQH